VEQDFPIQSKAHLLLPQQNSPGAQSLEKEQGSSRQLSSQTLFLRQQCCEPEHKYVDLHFVASTWENTAYRTRNITQQRVFFFIHAIGVLELTGNRNQYAGIDGIFNFRLNRLDSLRHVDIDMRFSA
jgi:hypothetical protein